MSKDGKQRGGFVLGLIVGLLLGLGVALGVAIYITKVPIPFVDKVPQRTAEQDAEEAARNKNWDPNAPLAGKGGPRAASGVVSQPPAVMASAAPHASPASAPDKAQDKAAEKSAEKTADKAVDKATDKAADKASNKSSDKGADKAAVEPYVYFVQAGAFTKTEDAEQQRAKLAMQGYSAKIYEREQSGRVVFRVRLGPFESRGEAEELQRKLESAGVESNLAKVQR